MRVRRSPLTILLLAIALLSVGIGVGVSEHSHAVATLNGALATRASQQAEILDDYFARAQSIDLLTAHNPAFGEFYRLPGSRTAGGRDRHVRAGGPILDKVNRALGYLEELFPDSIGEACFIDRGGSEIARVVRGERAIPADLSPDESANPFFGPTFGLRHGQVYQASPYVSPDTKEWVISNSTLMPTADGSKQAIVHFEVTIESFRQKAALDREFDVAIVDARTGAVVIDSRLPQRTGAKLGRPDDLRFRPMIAEHQPAGQLRLGDRPAAYQRATPISGNANHWNVVVIARTPVGRLYGVGVWPVGLATVALLLLGLSGLGSRASRRVLVHAATTDALTGIGNRRKLMADLQRELAVASPTRPLLLMLFDLNGFKAYNDTFGHPAGDALLARLGAALAAAMRGRGGAYRLGGDESASWPRWATTAPNRPSQPPKRPSPSTATASPSPPPTAPSCCPKKAQTPTRARRCAWSTSACTRRSPPGAAPPTARARTCCCAPSTNATRSSPNASRPPPGWSRQSANGWAWRATSSTSSSRPPSSTTSARSPSPTRSSTSRAPWTTTSGRSCAATR
jgi:hypothetical protein